MKTPYYIVEKNNFLILQIKYTYFIYIIKKIKNKINKLDKHLKIYLKQINNEIYIYIVNIISYK